ncbi:myristoyl :protein n-myristoyltransferase, partial [Cystoisospora suis]
MPEHQAPSPASENEQNVSAPPSSSKVAGRVTSQRVENHSLNHTEPPQPSTSSKDGPASSTTAGGGTDRGTLTSKGQLVSLMREMRLSNKGVSPPTAPHAFWDTQPVLKHSALSDKSDASLPEGPIETKTVADVRTEPYKLPEGFSWCECDVRNPTERQEIYELLSQHYVEDDDNLFRFNYSCDFLDWALTAPGAYSDWIIGVRVVSTKKLVGFITALPSQIRVYSHGVPMAEVNFLCVHKKLRSKRL